MNRNRARNTRNAKKLALEISRFWDKLEEENKEDCRLCPHDSCTNCNQEKWTDEALNTEFWYLAEKRNPLVQRRAARMAGMPWA